MQNRNCLKVIPSGAHGLPGQHAPRDLPHPTPHTPSLDSLAMFLKPYSTTKACPQWAWKTSPD